MFPVSHSPDIYALHARNEGLMNDNLPTRLDAEHGFLTYTRAAKISRPRSYLRSIRMRQQNDVPCHGVFKLSSGHDDYVTH